MTNKSESKERSNKFLKESNNDLRKKIRSSSRSNAEQLSLHASISDKDKVADILNKIVKNLKKNAENSKIHNLFTVNVEQIISKINEAIVLHNDIMQNYKINFKSYEENEVKFKTKYETTDKLIKEYEMKYVNCEKEKVLR